MQTFLFTFLNNKIYYSYWQLLVPFISLAFLLSQLYFTALSVCVRFINKR